MVLYFDLGNLVSYKREFEMIISWNDSNKPIETVKAFGFKIKHNDEEKIMWFPKSQVTIPNKNVNVAEVPDWLYDKRVEEMFL